MAPEIVTVVELVTDARFPVSPRYCAPRAVMCTTSIAPLPPPEAATAVSTSNCTWPGELSKVLESSPFARLTVSTGI